MPYWIISFFAGVIALTFCHKLPALHWLFMLGALLLLWLVYTRSLHARKILQHKIILILWQQLLAFSVGFCWALIYAYWIISWNLPQQLEGKKT